MVINYAACHAGCRVADIDLDQAREASEFPSGFAYRRR
jgi:hypothetical protein